MVMAHEIAHVRHRHPIIAMGRGFTVALALSSLAGLGDSAVQQWLGSMGMLPLLSFSREQEAQSDADALNGLYRLYVSTEARQNSRSERRSFPGREQNLARKRGLLDHAQRDR